MNVVVIIGVAVVLIALGIAVGVLAALLWLGRAFR